MAWLDRWNALGTEALRISSSVEESKEEFTETEAGEESVWTTDELATLKKLKTGEQRVVASLAAVRARLLLLKTEIDSSSVPAEYVGERSRISRSIGEQIRGLDRVPDEIRGAIVELEHWEGPTVGPVNMIADDPTDWTSLRPVYSEGDATIWDGELRRYLAGEEAPSRLVRASWTLHTLIVLLLFGIFIAVGAGWFAGYAFEGPAPRGVWRTLSLFVFLVLVGGGMAIVGVASVFPVNIAATAARPDMRWLLAVPPLIVGAVVVPSMLLADNEEFRLWRMPTTLLGVIAFAAGYLCPLLAGDIPYFGI